MCIHRPTEPNIDIDRCIEANILIDLFDPKSPELNAESSVQDTRLKTPAIFHLTSDNHLKLNFIEEVFELFIENFTHEAKGDAC